jgi:hypothetical protein
MTSYVIRETRTIFHSPAYDTPYSIVYVVEAKKWRHNYKLYSFRRLNNRTPVEYVPFRHKVAESFYGAFVDVGFQLECKWP